MVPEQRIPNTYWKPESPLADMKTQIVLARHEACVIADGTLESPVRNIVFDGISFQHTTRTFMKSRERLLRSDWCICRLGAFFLEGCENVTVSNCEFFNLGGNAYFASGYNRGLKITGSHFHNIGASAISFVGLTSAVHNPKYDPYGPPVPWEKINKKRSWPSDQRICSRLRG